MIPITLLCQTGLVEKKRCCVDVFTNHFVLFSQKMKKFRIFWLLLLLYSSAWDRSVLHEAKADWWQGPDSWMIYAHPFPVQKPCWLGWTHCSPIGLSSLINVFLHVTMVISDKSEIFAGKMAHKMKILLLAIIFLLLP